MYDCKFKRPLVEFRSGKLGYPLHHVSDGYGNRVFVYEMGINPTQVPKGYGFIAILPKLPNLEYTITNVCPYHILNCT